MKKRFWVLLIIFAVLLIGLLGLLYYQYVYYPSEGSLGIATRPDGATVIINGEVVGITPVEFKRKVGTYLLKIEKEGYKTIEQEVEIKGAKLDVLGFVLEGE